MKASELAKLQNQAKATRALEKIAAAAEGTKAKKPTLVERLVLGVKK